MSNKIKKSFYDPFDSMVFTYDKCFLCGAILSDSKTDEHVFPKWLLNKYNLWNQTLVLLNGTKIQYRQLTIPCCSTCNNEYLANLEREIEKGVNKGYEEFIKIDEVKIFQWMAKIFYGLLFKELSLLFERKDPQKGTITTPELLERYKYLHGFLQSVRIPFYFLYKPWSIFILNVYEYDTISDFNYHDAPIALTFSIRMGSVGIIACFEDNGSQSLIFKDFFDTLKSMKLHPIQLDELAAKVEYKATLLKHIPYYVINIPEEEGDETLVISPPVSLPDIPIYNDWDQKTYAKYLYKYFQIWGLSFEDIFKEPYVFSLIENEDGTAFIQLNQDGERIGFVNKNYPPTS